MPPRKPTSILEASGAFRKDPQRRAARKNEPKPVGSVGDPPAWMSADQKAIWIEHVAMLPARTSCQYDRGAFMALVRHAEAARHPKYNRDAVTAYLKALGLFGMTPADRSKVQVVSDTEKTDPFAEFAAN